MASWFDIDDTKPTNAPTRNNESLTQSNDKNNDNKTQTNILANSIDNADNTADAYKHNDTQSNTISTPTAINTSEQSTTDTATNSTTDDSLLALNEIEAEMYNIQEQYHTQLMNEITHNIQHIDSNKNINPYAGLAHNNDNIQFHSHIVQSYQKRVKNSKVQDKVSDITALGISDRKAFKLVHNNKKQTLKQKRAAEHSDKIQHKIEHTTAKNRERKRVKY